MLKNIFREFGRGLIWALAFFAVYWLFMLIIPFRTDPRVEEAWRARASEEKRSEMLLDRVERYYDRRDANVAKQEELNRRMEAVIECWEKQGAAKP